MAKCGLRLWVSLLFVMMVGLPALAPARADTYFPLVRITCVPQASYAAIETIGIDHVDPDARDALAAQGFRELGAIARTPVECELPQGSLLIEVVDFSSPPAQGECGAVADGSLEVSLAGRAVIFAKSMHGGCADLRRHDIWVSEYGIQHCVLTSAHAEMAATGVAVNCSTIRP